MPPPTGVWGIDIGQCALKALRLEMVEGKPTATAFDYVEHPKILSQPDADPDQLIREALEKFLSRNEIGTDEVAIGIAGQSGLARFVKLPPVEEKKIGDIVKFEAKQQIPFPLDEVVWDYQKIAGGDVTDGFAMETEIGLFAMKRDVISRYLGYFGGAKIEVHHVQMSPLALVNFATYEVLKKGGTTPVPEAEQPADDDAPRGKKRCVVVLDIGTEASNLIITDGGKIIWQRPLPLGGNNFTRALTKELKLTFAKAEHLKRHAAKSPELPQILKALKPVLQDFVGEVQRSLGYFTNTHRDAHVGYLIGLGSAFRLPGLQKYLAEKLQLDVRKPTGFTRLEGDTVLKDPLFVENVLTFPVAYGLALQGLGEARLTTNLLPAEIRTDRMIRAKKPYAAAAAAALLLGTAGLALGYGASYKAVNDPDIDKAIDTSKSAVSAYSSQETKFTQKKGEVEATQADVKLIVSGNDERLNWPRFEEVFTLALPRPGEGGNLDPKLWRTDNGAAAVAWFQERMRRGVKAEDAQKEQQSKFPEDLAMVNVEAVHTRWADSLATFLQNADAEVYGEPTGTTKRGFGDHIARWLKPEEKEPDGDKGWDKPKAPEGAGWVVEVRGWTDHKDGEQFIRDALLANLRQVDKFAEKGEKKISQYVPGVSDPVKGRVSHAFIYHVWRVPDPRPNVLVNIAQSYLDPLINPSAGGTAGGPGVPPGPGVPAGPTPTAPPMGMGMDPSGSTGAAAGPAAAGPAWTPLSGAAAAQTGSDSMMPGAPLGPGTPKPGRAIGFGSAGGPPAMAGKTAMTPPGMGPGPMGGSFPGLQPPPELSTGPARPRYEFVVMFIWREPVPSVTPADALGGGATGTTGLSPMTMGP